MVECIECRTRIELNDKEQNLVLTCPECGIELEFVKGSLVGLQLGPSEE